MRYIPILLLSFLTLCGHGIIGMEEVRLSLWFDQGSNEKALADVGSCFNYKIAIKDLRANGTEFSAENVLRAKAPKLLKIAILLMGNMAPGLTIQGDKKKLARKCMALAVLKGASPDLMAGGMTALWQAVKHEDQELVAFLCEHEANPNVCAIPVFFLARSVALAKMLHPKIEYTTRGLLNETVLHQAMQKEYPCDLVKYYCQQKEMVTATDKNNATPLATLLCNSALKGQEGSEDKNAIEKEKILLQTFENEQEACTYQKVAFALSAQLIKDYLEKNKLWLVLKLRKGNNNATK